LRALSPGFVSTAGRYSQYYNRSGAAPTISGPRYMIGAITSSGAYPSGIHRIVTAPLVASISSVMAFGF